MKRRAFIANLGKTGLVTWSLNAKVFFIGSTADAAEAFDLIMMGFSFYDGARLGRTGILQATQIAAMQPLSNIPYSQDSHGHTFNLTVDHLATLLAGQSVSVETSMMLNHKHEVRIDPSQRANPNQQGVVVNPPNTGDNPPPNPTVTPSNPPNGTNVVTRGAVHQHCTECHHTGAAIPLDFTQRVTPEILQNAEGRMRAQGDSKMPPGFRDRLTDSQIQAVLSSLRTQ